MQQIPACSQSLHLLLRFLKSRYMPSWDQNSLLYLSAFGPTQQWLQSPICTCIPYYAGDRVLPNHATTGHAVDQLFTEHPPTAPIRQVDPKESQYGGAYCCLNCGIRPPKDIKHEPAIFAQKRASVLLDTGPLFWGSWARNELPTSIKYFPHSSPLSALLPVTLSYLFLPFMSNH